MSDKNHIDPVTNVETTGHDWDGIKELNNPLPRWWLYVFYATIAWSVVYMVMYPSIPWGNGYFGGLTNYSQRVDVAAELEASIQEKKVYLDRIETASLEEIRADQELVTFSVVGGGAAFKENCAPCHGSNAAGVEGGYPSLIDDEWIWGGDLTAIHETIKHGIRWDQDDDSRYSEMSAFGTDELLERDQIAAVADYVAQMSGLETKATPAVLTAGKQVYEENCESCHMVGGVGDREGGAPALNDRVYLFGASRDAIYQQIFAPKHGVMPAWQDRLDPATIKMLTVYVHAQGGGE